MEETPKKSLSAIGQEILFTARNELYLNLPYLDVALCALRLQNGEGTTLSIATDGETLYYDGAFLVREDVLEQHPELEVILNQLAGKIPTEQMAELTYQVDVLGRTVDDVAREFLVSQGLLSQS